MKNTRLDETQTEIKIVRRNITTSDLQKIPPYSRKWRRAKEPLDKGEKESEKACLELNIQKNIKASGPITSKQIEGGKVETVKDFIFLGSKITVDCDCSHEIERCLLLGRKAMKIVAY